MSNEENILEFNEPKPHSAAGETEFTVSVGGADEAIPEATLDAKPDASTSEATSEAATDATSDAHSDAVSDEPSDDSSAEREQPVTVRGMLGNKTLEDVIEREAKEEQDTSKPFSLSRTLGGVIISRFFQKQIGVVLTIAVFVLVYISLRYMCQQRMVEINRVDKQIEKAHYKATVCNSMLTERSRESNVLRRLAEFGDSTLTISNEPPYLIKVEE